MAITISLKGVEGVTKEMLRLSMRYHSPSRARAIARPAAATFRNGLRSIVMTTFAGKPKSTGNTARSISILRLTRTRNVFVGANVDKGDDEKKKSKRYGSSFYFGFHDKGTFRGKRRHIQPKYMMDRAMATYGRVAAEQLGAALIFDLRYFA